MGTVSFNDTDFAGGIAEGHEVLAQYAQPHRLAIGDDFVSE
ncbi:hypothetical protein BraRD5C2_67250 [Bradyrhizobium sp. RD5-C2]|nr:hypothetical protein BraRD5C2_67250 [Bradyrhizobium sp. RD5-C2]